MASVGRGLTAARKILQSCRHIMTYYIYIYMCVCVLLASASYGLLEIRSIYVNMEAMFSACMLPLVSSNMAS